MIMKKVRTVLIILFSLTSCSMSDGIIDMKNGFIFARESKYSQVIERIGGDTIVPCSVLEFEYNQEYIVAVQVDNKDCMSEVGSDSKLNFWIIDCDNNEIYERMTIKDFQEMKQVLGIKLCLNIEK